MLVFSELYIFNLKCTTKKSTKKNVYFHPRALVNSLSASRIFS
uniref:Uncharacterized protein n=1 Tax=Arundo donax TaxID=35708 RepID=A0A0A9G215_ARUDO